MSSKLPLSNLFFEISSQNSIPFKLNQIKNEYSKYIIKQPNNQKPRFKNSTNSPRREFHKKRIMNELNFVYDRINTVQPKNHVVINDNVFPTQINKINHEQRNSESKNDNNKDLNQTDDDLCGIGYTIPRFPKKQYIVLKGNSKSNIKKFNLYAKKIDLELEQEINNDSSKSIRKDYDLFVLGNKIYGKQKPPIKFK